MAERAFPAPTVAQIGGSRIIATPFQFATTDDDNLQIVCANSLPGVVLTIQGRRLTPAGQIEPFSYPCIPPSDRTVETKNFKLGGGALLNLVIFASTGAPVIGQTYVSAKLIRGLTGATIVLGALLGGYVTAAQPLAYPGSLIENSISGGGYLRTVVGTDPAAGVQISETVPTGARWQLLSFSASLTASAAAGNRRPRLLQWEPGNPYNESPLPDTIGPGGTGGCYWAAGLPLAVAVSPIVKLGGLPTDLPLSAGDQIITNCENFDAGDNWTAPKMRLREWLEVSA